MPYFDPFSLNLLFFLFGSVYLFFVFLFVPMLLVRIRFCTHGSKGLGLLRRENDLSKKRKEGEMNRQKERNE